MPLYRTTQFFLIFQTHSHFYSMADSFACIYNAFKGFERMMDAAMDKVFDEDSTPHPNHTVSAKQSFSQVNIRVDVWQIQGHERSKFPRQS
jgi:hypothetical protein